MDKVGIKDSTKPTPARRKLLTARFETLLKKSKGVNFSDPAVRRLLVTPVNSDPVTRQSENSDPVTCQPETAVKQKKGTWRRLFLVGLSTTIIVPFLIGILSAILEVELTPSALKTLFKDSPCLLENNPIAMEIARPLVNCGLCSDIRTVPVETNLTKTDFIKKYAYSGVPVLVKGATTTWSAMSRFSFQFFKELYQSTDGALDDVEEDCQFFPYKTEFNTLQEVFEMDGDRADLKPGHPHWYIGWSNCHPSTGAELRKHYKKPYFLPEDSETSTIDWLFMGGSGEGANLHLDYVQRPSWQGQISGRKSWALVPSPECEAVCHSLNVTVEKGDIFVVDTNKWYHSTFVHPGEISITIGSEYD